VRIGVASLIVRRSMGVTRGGAAFEGWVMKGERQLPAKLEALPSGIA
jgi:hypothetical protein